MGRVKLLSSRIPVLTVFVWVLALSSGSLARAAGDMNQQSCSDNETLTGFQAFLPDCRAYEMVSPTFKDGWEVSEIAAAPDGSKVLAKSLGAFAGTESVSSGIEGAIYVFNRSGSGWSASTISPPASLAAYNLFRDAESGLGRTIWMLRAASDPFNQAYLYAREPDGSFVEIGPMAPPSSSSGPESGATQGYETFRFSPNYVGGASDFSHVLFQLKPSEQPMWPGDTTAIKTSESLYEYVGRNNAQPRLVGVNNEGHLISNCETALGSPQRGDTYNAVSSNGMTVFFSAIGPCSATPVVTELYARLKGIETVAISEPSRTSCGSCNTTIKHAATFQGASEDGSKVFFLTQQSLLEGATTQNLYEYDFDNPLHEKLVRVSTGSTAPEVQGVARVSEDGSRVYFVAKGILAGVNREGASPSAGQDNFYVWERNTNEPSGRVKFIGTLSGLDTNDWSVADNRPVQATPDGRFIVFSSVAHLTPGDTSTQSQVFEYDAVEETLVRVSRGQAGFPAGEANADGHRAVLGSPHYAELFERIAAVRGLSISADGSRVAFTSSGALTPDAEAAAAAGAESVYEYRSTGSIPNGDVYLISDGKQTDIGASGVAMDPSGRDVLFASPDRLLQQDTDTQFDIYDAREGGGFAAPISKWACSGEACHEASSAVPVFDVAQTMLQAPGENLALPAPPGQTTKPKVRKPAHGSCKRKAGHNKRCRHRTKRGGKRKGRKSMMGGTQ
jgi:hypothetical protein